MAFTKVAKPTRPANGFLRIVNGYLLLNSGGGKLVLNRFWNISSKPTPGSWTKVAKP